MFLKLHKLEWEVLHDTGPAFQSIYVAADRKKLS